MLVTFGEPVLRYVPPHGERLETADEYAVYVGGPEATVAVAAARLGVDAAWTSKLPDSPLGRRVLGALGTHGVEPLVSYGEGRVTTCYSERGPAPRRSTDRYERAEAAALTASREDLAVDRVRRADVFHVSAVTPALSTSLSSTTGTLLEAAADAGTSIAFDLDFRSDLWSADAARKSVANVAETLDVLFAGEADASAVFDRGGDPVEVAAGVASETGVGRVVLLREDAGAVAYDEGTVNERPGIETDARDEFGTRGAFVGGFLAAQIQAEDVPTALGFGAATAALARTIDGDLPTVTRPEVEAVVDAHADAR